MASLAPFQCSDGYSANSKNPIKAGGEQLVFRAGTTGAFAANIALAVPTNGATVPFFAAGKFEQPSSGNGDVAIAEEEERTRQ
jgi:hypothetical protein